MSSPLARQAPDSVVLRAGVRGVASARVTRLSTGRRVVEVRVNPVQRRGALSAEDSATMATGAAMALAKRLPLVLIISSSGVDMEGGIAALHGWGATAKALADCSGVVPIIAVAFGLAVSGPALLLGMADVVIMTGSAVAYVSGPAAVAELTGLQLGPTELGGSGVHSRMSGLAALVAEDLPGALDLVGTVLAYLPDHLDTVAPRVAYDDPGDRPTPELSDLLPPTDTGSYDIRRVISAIADDGELLELRGAWAPQLVTALIRVEGVATGVVANQPQSMAGTLDIAASQKGAGFVSMCDTFNLPIVTLVDTPGFMPGKDLEWRGMIRHGAQLCFAYAEASVPRVCLVVRKAFGGAYIVMDSKGMGNDICLAWPAAQVAVMGAEGAVQILHRRADAPTQAALAQEYRVEYLNPYLAAERGFVDEVIDPVDTRRAVAGALRLLDGKRERLARRKHGNGPL